MSRNVRDEGVAGSNPATPTIPPKIKWAGAVARLGFKTHPQMLRHACGYALATEGMTRAPYMLTSVTGTSSIRCDTRSGRRRGSRISGAANRMEVRK